MTDQQNPDRPQTLLEAAKVAMDADENVPSYDAWRTARNHLRAAIAREEAKPATDAQVDCQAGRAAWWQIKANEANDRAQQAESSAAWHKAESERLSQALAEAKRSVAYLANRACDTIPIDTSGHWQQRAEDAEAKVRNLQRQNRDAIDERDLLRLRTATIDNLRQRAEKAEAESERLGAELALAKNQLTLAVERSERLSGQLAGCHHDLGEANKQRQRAEEAEAELAERRKEGMDQAWQISTIEGQMRTWKARAEEAEAALAKAKQDRQLDRAVDALTRIEPRDPTTGFTFATYRHLLEALGGKS